MISIVVPAYQESNAILDFIARLYAKHQVDECVIVDASEVAEFEALKVRVAEHFEPESLTYISATIKGRALQMNQGAAMTSLPILLFLHADTRLPDGALEMIQAGIDAGKHWGRFDVQLDTQKWPYRMIAAMMNWRSRRTGMATGDQAIFMTRAAFDKVGGFDQIPLMEDIAISRKLKRIGLPLCFDVKVLTSARRWEQNGVLKTILLMWWLRLAYWLGVSPTTLAKWYR